MDGETKRDRVRRLFIRPMQDLGWRKPGNVKSERHAEDLVKLADDLGYMSDQGLDRLVACMRHRGEGKGRDAWPPRARIIAFAELIEARPIEDMPALLRWFRSEAGRRAEMADRLVEEYGFWQRHKRPPQTPADLRQIDERRAANARRAELIEDRRGRGVPVDPQDHAWMRAYQDRLYWLRDIVAGDAEEGGEA